MATSFLRPSTLDARDERYLQDRFRRHSAALRTVIRWVLDVREMRKIEQRVLHGRDETVMAFKSSQIEAVGMTAVASAIISQLSSTTLQLPAISNVDWRAGGFIIAALLFSVLAVMLSCVQQQVLGTLNEPGGIRMWLSNGSGGKTRSETGSGSGSRRDDDRGGLQTSVASLLLLKLPNALLLYAVACFLVGFGLFLGLAWRQDLENTPSRDSNFAVMVLYIVVGCVTFFGSGALLKWKMSEVDQAENVIGKDIEEGHADHETGDGHGNSDDDDDDDSNKGENHRLLGKAKGSRKFSSKEVRDHEKIAEAMEEAAKAHRELAKLMSNALQGRGDS